MTIRQQIYNPNTILYAADIQDTADNGVVEISAIAELDQVGGEINVVFCKEDYNLYKRIAEGAGGVGVAWEVFSGGLPGLKGWATLTKLSGTFTISNTYTEDGVDYKAVIFTDDGTIETKDGGLVEALLVGGANPAPARSSAGMISKGFQLIPGTQAHIDVSKSLTYNTAWPLCFLAPSRLYTGVLNQDGAGDNIAMAMGGHNSADQTYPDKRAGGGWGDKRQDPSYSASGPATQQGWWRGLTSTISGEEKTYGQSQTEGTLAENQNTGCVSNRDTSGSWAAHGVVIVRVPASNFEVIRTDFYNWSYFAKVEDGVVVEVKKTPEGVKTFDDNGLIPCESNVGPGALYENGEFVAPPLEEEDV